MAKKAAANPWSSPYQLIITDLEMPKLNRYEVIQAFSQDPRRTASDSGHDHARRGEDRQMAVSVGASKAILPKPVEERGP